MKISPWKRWLSYLGDVTLERVSTEIHPSLTICLSKGRLQLYANKAIYSFEDLYLNFSNTFRLIDLKPYTGGRVLVLGLGLGSVIQILEQEHQLNASYTAAELDEGIIDLAQRYVLQYLPCPVTVYPIDAYAYINQYEEEAFDMIIMDVFHDDIIPGPFSQPAFLHRIRNILSPQGLFLYNRLYRTDEDQRETAQYQWDIFAPVFPNHDAIDVEGNRVLIHDRSYLKTL